MRTSITASLVGCTFTSFTDAMFAILVPATLLPLIFTLFWAERKAKRLGIVDEILDAEGIPRDALAQGEV